MKQKSIRRKKSIYELYGYYYEDIGRLSEAVTEGRSISVKSLGISSGHIASAYAEMARDDFKGTIFMYLASIQIRHWIQQMADMGENSKIDSIPPTAALIYWQLDIATYCPEFDAYVKARKKDRPEVEREFIRGCAALTETILMNKLAKLRSDKKQ